MHLNIGKHLKILGVITFCTIFDYLLLSVHQAFSSH